MKTYKSIRILTAKVYPATSNQPTRFRVFSHEGESSPYLSRSHNDFTPDVLAYVKNCGFEIIGFEDVPGSDKLYIAVKLKPTGDLRAKDIRSFH